MEKKTAQEILKPYIETPFRHTKIVDADDCIKAMEEFASQFKYDFSHTCKCEDSPGETWCCNLCGLPTSKHTAPSASVVTEIKRYFVGGDEEELNYAHEDEDGDWVKYDDMVSILSGKDRQIEELSLQKDGYMELHNDGSKSYVSLLQDYNKLQSELKSAKRENWKLTQSEAAKIDVITRINNEKNQFKSELEAVKKAHNYLIEYRKTADDRIDELKSHADKIESEMCTNCKERILNK